MPILTKIVNHIIKDEPFFNCKKCNKKGVYNKNKILCDDCLKKQRDNFNKKC